MSSPQLPTSASPTNLISPTLPPVLPTLATDSTASHFSDSGLGMTNVRTPSPKRTHQSILPQKPFLNSPSKTTNSISSRLEQLAALAWEAEEDDRLDDRTRSAVQSQLNAIEAQLEGRTRGNEQTSSDVDLSNSTTTPNSSAASILEQPDHDALTGIQESVPSLLDLDPILQHLSATVASMRIRLSESNHLHNLAVSRLSSIARSNIDLTTQLSQTRRQSTALSHANAALRMRVDELEVTTTQQAVAVSAMTGAVAGLEEYVRSSSPRPKTPNQQGYSNGNGHMQTPKTSARPPTVVRGSGRFRGKYPVSGSSSSPSHLDRRNGNNADLRFDFARPGALDPSVQPDYQQTELQEGILAWVRGFRDVEAGWREIDANVTAGMHRSPTRFGAIHGSSPNDQSEGTPGMAVNNDPETPTRSSREVSRRPPSQSEEGDSVLLQGDKLGGSDIFGQDEDFGEFQSVTTTGDG